MFPAFANELGLQCALTKNVAQLQQRDYGSTFYSDSTASLRVQNVNTKLFGDIERRLKDEYLNMYNLCVITPNCLNNKKKKRGDPKRNIFDKCRIITHLKSEKP